MRTIISGAILPCAVLLLAATAAHAQSAGNGDAPTCASLGVQRVVIMTPPGKTPAEIQDAVTHGGLFPAGTEALIVEPGQLTAMRDRERFGRRMHEMLRGLLDQGLKIDGSVSVVLKLDENGDVVEVTPNSGNAAVDRALRRTWAQAKFEPYVIDGCRAVAWVQVPQNFQSDWEYGERRVQVDANPAPAPNP
ncbi:MAG: energy transducer TonB [Gemmatimonadetes bacterium]|nr:energy transducer TonB [Gemmatimonadota bacterium]